MRTPDKLQALDSSVATAIICEQIARAAGCFGRSLRSVVLTGSLARNEGTFIRTDRGLRLLGDVDCFLVFHKGKALPAELIMNAVYGEIGKAIEACGIIAEAELKPVHDSYFMNLPRHIATCELRKCGRVIWGDREVLSLIPAFGPSQILLEDAWRMLANRMIELLDAIASRDTAELLASPEAQYCTVKLYLDMATSYLVFAGSYKPGYRERSRVLLKLAENEAAQSGAPFSLAEFAERVAACTRRKLETDTSVQINEAMLADAILFARLLWKWELARLTGQSLDLSESDLMRRWMRSQCLKSRVRGWASVLRRSGWVRSWRQWPRWIRLGRQASPRCWIYRTATELFFEMPDALKRPPGTQSGLRRLMRQLPSSNIDKNGLGWRSLAHATASEYRRYLTTTCT